MATWLMLLIVPIHMALQNGGHSCLLHHYTVILEIGLIYKHAMIVFQLHCQEPSQKIAAIQKSEGLLNRDCPQTYGSDHLQYQDYLDGVVVGRILSALLRRQISSHMFDSFMGSPFCHPLKIFSKSKIMGVYQNDYHGRVRKMYVEPPSIVTF